VWVSCSAPALIFFAYIGFEEIVQLAEETRNAPRTIPRALLLSIVITTALYVTVALSAISGLGWRQLGASKSPLADVAALALGQPSLRHGELRTCEGLARSAVADGCRDADRLPHASRVCTENNRLLGLVSSLDLLQSIASGRVRADNGNLDSARS